MILKYDDFMSILNDDWNSINEDINNKLNQLSLSNLYIKDDMILKEKLGYNDSLDRYVDMIANIIFTHIKKANMSCTKTYELFISELNIFEFTINYNRDDISIREDNNKLYINYTLGDTDLNTIKVNISHELHHIFINHKGNTTNSDYFIVNELLKEAKGYSKTLLFMYYLSFKDEMQSNIQMLNLDIRNKNIKNKDDFKDYLKDNFYYNTYIKMRDLDIDKYISEIKNENNFSILDSFNIDNMNKQIKKSGKIMINKISKMFQ